MLKQFIQLTNYFNEIMNEVDDNVACKSVPRGQFDSYRIHIVFISFLSADCFLQIVNNRYPAIVFVLAFD